MCTSKLTAASLLAVILSACSSSTLTEQKRPEVYQCGHGRELRVHTGEEHATVDYQNKHYELERRSSGIGLKYTSPEATLIIDDENAVFVDHNTINLQTCFPAR